MAYILTSQALQETQVKGMAAWSARLTVTSTDPDFYPPKALVFQAETAGDPNTRGWFTAVASPAQLEEYPEDAPAATSGGVQQPYYRMDSVTLISRNPTQIRVLTAEIHEELEFLASNLEAMEDLTEVLVMLSSYRPGIDGLWPGIPELGPFLTSGATESPALSAILTFSPVDFDASLYVLSSEADGDGTLDIVDAAAWSFSVPPQELPLARGNWTWRLDVTDTSNEEFTVVNGTIQIL